MRYEYFAAMNFEDFAGGRVLYHMPGTSNFPVRLAGEIFMRCVQFVEKEKAVLYDPCCGGGHLLTVLGFLCGDRIGSVYGSDIDEEAVALAAKNLSLLTEEGLARRKAQLTDVPYGNPASWSEDSPFAVDILLDSVTPVIHDRSVVAVCSDKSQKIANPRFKRLQKMDAGKRKIELLRKI